MSGVGAPAITAPHPPGGDDPLPPVYVRGWAPGYTAPPPTPGGDEPPTAPICPGLGPRLYGPEPWPEANL
eukprot:gene21836-biopygen13229